MLLTIFNKARLLRLTLIVSGGIALSACSSLNQRPYDVDGIYNNSKIVVEDTHYHGEYYSEYFKEKTEDSRNILRTLIIILLVTTKLMEHGEMKLLKLTSIIITHTTIGLAGVILTTVGEWAMV